MGFIEPEVMPAIRPLNPTDLAVEIYIALAQLYLAGVVQFDLSSIQCHVIQLAQLYQPE